jgi:tetratricopeptide (TPR) repeat protein
MAERRLQRAIAAGDCQGIDAAVTMFEVAWAGSAANSSSHQPVALINFANALLDQFEATSMARALTQALNLLDSFEHVCPPGDTWRLPYLRATGRALLWAAQRTGKHAVIHRAVQTRREAVALAPRGHDLYGACMLDLGVTLIHRNAMANAERDIHEAIQVLEAAVRYSDDVVIRPGALSSLGNAYLIRFLCTAGHHRTDLPKAIEAHTAAVNAMRGDDPQAGTYLSDLGTALMREYEHTREVAALKASVARHREAVAVTAPGEVEEVARRANLGVAVLVLHEHSKDPAVVDDAIAVFRAAAGSCSEDHAYYARCLYGLAAALFRRGELWGAQFDFDESTELAKRALDATPATHPDRPTRAAAFGQGAACCGSISTLRSADEVLADPLSRHPRERPTYAMLQSNRGAILSALAARDLTLSPAQVRQKLEQAVQLTRAAVENTPADHSEYPARLFNFTSTSVALARLIHDATLTEQSLRLHARLADAARSGSAGVVSALIEAMAFACRYDLLGDPDALRAALAAFRRAATNPAAAVTRRMAAAHDGAHLAARSGTVDVAVELFTAAVRLMDDAMWRGMHHRDHERLLQQCGTLPSDAAAMAIAAGRLDHAVALLERGRGVLLDRRIDDSADLSSVRQQRPALEDRVEEVRTKLRNILIPDLDADVFELPCRPPHEPSPVDLRSHHVRELERLIEQIRSLPGQQDCFRSSRPADLRSAIGSGTVVIVNISSYRCDALAVTQDGVTLIPLPDITHGDVQRHAHYFLTQAQLTSQSDDHGRDARNRMNTILEWMWDKITGPILETLGLTDKAHSPGAVPHIYWCPTGHATFLPLHAAGRHDTRQQINPQTVIDRAASSYIPKLRAVAIRSDQARTPPISNTPLIVSMPQTPGKPDLPTVVNETQAVLHCFPHATHLSGPTATLDAVIAALPRHPWVHFSGHSVTDQMTPLNGGLELHDGRLTMQRLASMHLPSAQFAFLSACGTYQATTKLPDESITLATALRAVGYQNVIATLWPISDTHSLDIVRHAYMYLTTRNSDVTRLSPDDSAHALRDATLRIRDETPNRPDRWVPFIHTGRARDQWQRP